MTGSGYPGSGDGATMPPSPRDPSGSPPPSNMRPDQWRPDLLPSEQGEILGHSLDPVRACALQAAAELVGLASELVSREDLQDLGEVVLTLAHRFETWLVGLSSEAP